MSEDPDPQPLVNHTMLIGMVALNWNGAHEEVFRLFVVLSNLPYRAAMAIYFSLTADSAQRDITAGLIKSELADHPDLKTAAIGFLNRLGRLGGDRNAAIHTMWAIDLETRSFTPSPFVKHSGRLEEDFKTQFARLADELAEIQIGLLRLLPEIQMRLSWHGIPPPRSPVPPTIRLPDTDTPDIPESP